MLDAGADELMRVFRKLSTERQMGWSMGPIPISAIWCWEEREGISAPELRDFLEAILMGVDAKVCAKLREEPAKRKPEPTAGRPNRPPVVRRRR